MDTVIDSTPAIEGSPDSTQRRDSRPPVDEQKPLTEAGLCDWIATAKPGQSLQYHEGLLLRDRAEVTSTLPSKARARLHAVARRAWIACELGLIHLFSVKVEENHYRYLAIRSRNSLKPADIRARLRQVSDAPQTAKSH